MPLHSIISKQSGSVLIISLVLLLVLTILGVSTMTTASVEVHMAANEKFSENAFQMAETGNSMMLRGLNGYAVSTPDVTDGNNCDAVQASVDVGNVGSYTNELCYQGCGLKDGSSTSIGAHVYSNTSRGSSNNSAHSTHTQGFLTDGLACNF